MLVVNFVYPCSIKQNIQDFNNVGIKIKIQMGQLFV